MSIYKPIPDFESFPFPDADSDALLEVAKEALDGIFQSVDGNVVDGVIRKLGREAAAETGAIEGLYELKPGDTRTIVAEHPDWKEVLDRQNELALAMFEAQLDSYEFIREQAREKTEINELWIKELHARVCANQRTFKTVFISPDGAIVQQEHQLHHGAYKENENAAIRRDGERHTFAPVHDVRPEMRRLVEQVRSQAFSDARPIVKAAYAQYCLTHIHPFSDGNGRTARAFASLFTYETFGVPVIVYADRKQRYLQALENANAGNYSPLIEHFQYRVVDTMERAKKEISAATEKTASERFDELMRIRASDSQVTVADKRMVAERIVKHAIEELEKTASLLNDKSGEAILFQIQTGYYDTSSSSLNFSHGYEHSGHSFTLRATMKKPAEIGSHIHIGAGVSTHLDSMYVFEIVAKKPFSPIYGHLVTELQATYEDAFPDLGTSIVERVRIFCDEVIKFLLSDLQSLTKAALRQAGAATVDDHGA